MLPLRIPCWRLRTPTQLADASPPMLLGYVGVAVASASSTSSEAHLRDAAPHCCCCPLMAPISLAPSLLQAQQRLKSLPSLVDVPVAEGKCITVCGDVHGQYYDLLNIFELNGLPSEDNPYLFNGEICCTWDRQGGLAIVASERMGQPLGSPCSLTCCGHAMCNLQWWPFQLLACADQDALQPRQHPLLLTAMHAVLMINPEP